MNKKKSPILRHLLEQRATRRRFVSAGARYAGLASLAACIPETSTLSAGRKVARVLPSEEDSVIVPPGHAHRVVLRWGDPIVPAAEALDSSAVRDGALLRSGAAASQAMQFGYNCDGMDLLELDDGRVVVCVNHEYPMPDLMFPGWAEARATRSRGDFARENPECVPYMQSCVGLSVVEIDARNAWQPVLDSPLNRRVTTDTPVELAGPAREHRLLEPSGTTTGSPRGTLGNCAGGMTPWGSYLTAEENVDDYFGRGRDAELEPEAQRAHARFGFRRRDSSYRWEYADSRFDLSAHPNELLRFGWIVEIDPLDPGKPIKKRTSLGRFKHEGATSTLASDGRVAVYMGDDQIFEYFYKFVTRDRFDAQNRDANRDLLDDGTLYVARMNGDGSGEWLPLVWSPSGPLSPASGFASQADVVLRCREAADIMQATPLDRPEDVAVEEASKRVYLACTANSERGSDRENSGGRSVRAATDAANPRRNNRYGHIIELSEADDDPGARAFRWEVFILAGRPTAEGLETELEAGALGYLTSESTYFGGFANARELSAFANPDNLTFDTRGNLWIVTDGNQPGGHNNGCFVCPTSGEFRGAVTQFMSGPIGAEVCGCRITRDGRTLFLNVQHPGSGGSLAEPSSHWPDGAPAAPRPSLVVIEPVDRAKRLGEV